MGRRSRVETETDGSTTLRVTLQPYTWRLITRYAARLKITGEDATRIFLEQLEANLSEGSAAWLSTDWQRLLRSALDELPPELTGVDITKLHRSDKTKSGFVGIYANGAGFRATGRRGEYLGTFKTAELAAHHRWQHYKRNKLPYGEMEIAIDEARRFGEQGDDEHLRDIVLETARLTGTLHLYDPDQGGTAGRHLKMAGFDDDADFDSARAKVKQHDEALERNPQ